MDRFAHLDWPFFDDKHRKLAREADAWAAQNLAHSHGEDADAICKRLVQDLGCAGYLRHSATEKPDVRSIALLREVFAYHSGLADFSFVMQGLGSGPIALAGDSSLKERYLSKAAAGDAIAAFALSEPDAGSDVQALTTKARKQGNDWILDGTKTWISNGGIAHFYVVFAKAEEGISAFVVDAKEVDASERIDIIAPHPMAVVKLKGSKGTLLGEPGQGFKLAMRNLDIFRTTVAAAAAGFARRALDEALNRAKQRKMFGHTLGDLQMSQAKLADMATSIDAAALLTYRSAWKKDVKGERVTREAAMAKMFATEAAQQVIDNAVQLLGGLGVKRGHPVERLYREVRALRIYEGATEVQKLIIAKDLLKELNYTAHLDTFTRDNLPPLAQWPELRFDLPELQYPSRLNCAAELLDKPVTRGHGHRVALRSPDGECTYTQLFTQANRLANVLVREMGVKPGNRVLLRGPNNPIMAACWFAVMKAGGVCVATMPLLRAKELTEIVEKAEISYALCDRRLDAELKKVDSPRLKEIRYWYDDSANSLDNLALRQPLWFTNVATAADDVALIAFTSGTTGQPKGTMHFHRDVIAMCDLFPRSCLGVHKDDIVCGTPPLAFTFGLGGMLCFPMRYGASSVLMEKLAPESLLETIDRFRATVCFTTPIMYRQMALLASRFDLSSLGKCVSAGEALPDATRSAFREATGIEIIDGIGSTEMIHIFISHTPARARRGATGYAIPGYQATVLNDEFLPCRPGEVGKLAVKGPTGCRYLADARQKDYVRDGWNVTGDAYSMDADGYFFFQARTDDMIVSAGYNIAGPEVESALLAHPAVAECGVIGAPDEERGTIVKAFVVLKSGNEKNEDMKKALQEHVKNAIAPYKYPRAIEFIDALPRTETGKVQRFKLRQA